MKTILWFLFVCVLAAMLAVTIRASLAENILAAGRHLWPDRWFQATLCDAYCGFLLFFAWVAYKERTMLPRVLWFVAIMLLGNIAMSIYAMWQLKKARPFSAEAFLLRRATDSSSA